MKKIPLLVALAFAASQANAAAQMWCLNDTTTCSYGTPSLSKLNKEQRAATIHKMYISKYIEAVNAGTFEAVTANQLIVLAKEKLKEPEPVPCGAGFTGFEPNCVPVEPPTSDNGDTIQSGQMPAVDISKYMTPAQGSSDLRLRAETKQPRLIGNEGAFRINCPASHMSNDDPLVYPNQQAATHSHTFFGNTSVDYKSDLSKLAEVGNSTCSGGIMNRTGYWIPTMIDGATNTPIAPSGIEVYYKSRGIGKTKAMPEGLRMIAGNAAATSEQGGDFSWTKYRCNDVGTTAYIPECKQGSKLSYHFEFPECWDGKNLDSPNHKDHMAYGTYGGSCPASHPVLIPTITYNVKYKVHTNDVSQWRLSSDNYEPKANNRGYSVHGDWVNGWNKDILNVLIEKCINGGLDCGSSHLGDGREYH